MPPYLRLGSVPRKWHIAHPHQPGFLGQGLRTTFSCVFEGF